MQEQPIQQFGYPPASHGLPKWQLWTGVVAVVVIISIIAYFILSAVATQQTTGILEVTASSSKATIGIQNTQDISPRIIGTGTASVRLEPGSYRVTLTDGSAQTLTTASVTAKQTTNLHLSIKAPLKASKLTDVAGQNIYQTGQQLLFFNTATTGLATYQFGKPSVNPYLDNVALISQAFWLDPTHVYTQGDNGWFYYDGTTNQPLVDSGQEGDAANNDTQPQLNSVSFNAKGQGAYVSSGRGIFLINQPATTPRKLGTLSGNTDAQTSIAPNGDIIISTPVVSSDNKATASLLYQNEKLTQLPSTLQGIANVTWSPDSSHISYTTTGGIYTYDLTSKKTNRILVGSPTNQLSSTWLTNSEIIYAQDGAIWRYNTNGDISTKLITIEGVLNATRPFTLGTDNQTVYFGTAPDSKNNGGAIYGFLPHQDTLPKAQLQTLQQSLEAAQGILSIKGLESLTERGLSDDQVAGTKTALYNFGQAIHQHLSSISIDTSNVGNAPYNPEVDDSPKLLFTFTTDNKTKYNAVLAYSGLSDIRLVVSNTANQQIFDSQTITTNL